VVGGETTEGRGEHSNEIDGLRERKERWRRREVCSEQKRTRNRERGKEQAMGRNRERRNKFRQTHSAPQRPAK
jgi:hypothetical protein